MKTVALDDGNEALGVAWIGGIAGSLEASRPATVVGGREGEETGIAARVAQKE